jgi:hypothetical protein
MRNFVSFAITASLVTVLSACGSTMTTSQTVTLNDFLSNTGVEGVDMCWSLNDEEDNCVTSDANGTATGTAEFKSGDILVFNASKSGYFPFMVEYHLNEDTPEEGEVTWAMIGDTLVDVVVSALGADADPAKGHVTVLLVDGEAAIAGGTAEMTVGTADQGPNYNNADVAAGIFSDSGMTTEAGIAVFNNVTPGVVELTVNVDGKTCTATAGEAVGDNMVSTTIEAGKLTYTSLLCQ